MDLNNTEMAGHQPADTRERIVRAAAQLLGVEGRQGVTTRAVAAHAGVQAPAIYRLFGDMDGLLDAVAEHLLQDYVSNKAKLDLDPDPVQDLQNGWDQQIAFNLAHPAVFRMMVSDPARAQSPAAIAGSRILKDKIGRVARAGRLKVSEERAENMIRAASYGALLIILGQPESERDHQLAEAAREAVFAAIIGEQGKPGATAAVTAAITLKASLGNQNAWSAAEKGLMREWLDRVIGAA